MATLQVTALSLGWGASRRPPLPHQPAHPLVQHGHPLVQHGHPLVQHGHLCVYFPERSLGKFELLEHTNSRKGWIMIPSPHTARNTFPTDTVELNVDMSACIK